MMNADSLLMLSRNIHGDLKTIFDLKVQFGDAGSKGLVEEQQETGE